MGEKMYELKTMKIDGAGEDAVMTVAYTTDGHYIGDEDHAKYLDARGIAPTVRNGQDSVCSIGFCEAEQKWYGWSHRAMFGFGIGSTVKKGDCAYQPPADDFLEDCRRFWHDENYHAETFVKEDEQDGVKGALVYWLYNDKVPNASVRGTEAGHFTPYPDAFGRGEWTAQTLEDARQMAEDFAEGVG